MVISMLILIVLTILVVSAVKNATLNEKMAGNYLDRSLAQQIAEQSLRQGTSVLVSNGEACLSGCAVDSNGNVTATTTADNTVPSVWSDANSITTTLATGQKTLGSYSVKLLDDTFVPSAKAGCKAYSVMGKGIGRDSRTSVVLQTIAFVCAI